MSGRALPPFEPSGRAPRPRTDAERVAAAQRVLREFRHDDVLGSLADLHDALGAGPTPGRR